MASASHVLFVGLLSAFCMGCLASPTLRIVGGNEASGEEFPYMVSVRRDTAHVCGGTIIAPNWILTAGHCVSQNGATPVDPSAITVRVGSKNQFAGGKIVSCLEIFIHESYGSFLNDVAVLRIPDLTFSNKIQKIAIASKSDVVTPGQAVVIAGWGRTEAGGPNNYKLHYGEGVVLSTSDCENEIGYGHKQTLCLAGSSKSRSCNGDAGGPAVYKNEVVGIANFVMGTCGAKYPDVYARVSYFYEWIMSKIDPKV